MPFVGQDEGELDRPPRGILYGPLVIDLSGEGVGFLTLDSNTRCQCGHESLSPAHGDKNEMVSTSGAPANVSLSGTVAPTGPVT